MFFNICTSICVPLKDEGTDVNETEVVFFVAGQQGKTEDGADVYDIVVHPAVAVKSKATHAALYKRKVKLLKHCSLSYVSVTTKIFAILLPDL